MASSPPRNPGTPPRALLRIALENLAVAAACIVGAWISNAWTVPALGLTPILLEAGVASAAVLVLGTRILPAIALAAVASSCAGVGFAGLRSCELGFSEDAAWTLAVSAASVLEAAWVRYAVRRALRDSLRVETAGEGVRLMLVAGPGSTWIGALLVVGAHLTGHDLPTGGLTTTYLAVWAARTMGVWIFLLPAWAWVSDPIGRRRTSLASVGLPVACALGVASGGYLLVRELESVQSRREFGRLAVNATGDLRYRVGLMLQSCDALGAYLVAAGDDATQVGFEAFAGRALSPTPALFEVSWLPRVTREQRAEYEAQASRESGKPIRIVDLRLEGDLAPATERSLYFPQRFLWLREGSTEPEHLDTRACTDVARNVETALRLSTPVASSPLDLRGRRCILLYVPVDPARHAGLVNADDPRHGERFTGCLEANFDAQEMVRSSLTPSVTRFMTVRVEDHTDLGEALNPPHEVDPARLETLGWLGEPRHTARAEAFAQIADDDGATARAGLFPHEPRDFVFESHATIAERRYCVSMAPTVHFWRQHASWSSWLAGILGGAACVVFGLYGLMLATRRGRVEELVTRRTQDLEVTVRRLTIANDRAREAARVKAEFLANISHELRTPLLSILGFTDLMTREAGKPEERRTWARTVHESGRRLLSTLNDVLDVARAEAGQLHLERAPCELTTLVRECLAAQESTARAKGLSLAASITAPIPARIETDAVRLRQILSQLIGNAVKFTERGAVRVLLAPIGDRRIEVRVIDTGPGLTPELRERIFEPFTQGDGSTSRRHGGAGLGLTLARDLARLLGGDLRAESEPGIGSTFVLELDVGDAARQGTVAHLDAEPPSLVRRDGLRLEARVLVAEDNDDTQLLLSAILGRAGSDFVLAGDGRSALAAFDAARLEKRPFDIVLLDVQMPGMDGHEAARALRARGFRGPILALTAHAMAADRDRCIESGCDDYLSKPFEAHVLLEKCQRHLQGRARLPAEGTAT